jgi:hypothetical protein
LQCANYFIAPTLVGTANHLHLGTLSTTQCSAEENSAPLSHTAKSGSKESARCCLAKVKQSHMILMPTNLSKYIIAVGINHNGDVITKNK